MSEQTQTRVYAELVPMVNAASLRHYLDPADSERAAMEAYAWIKALRHLPVDGVPLRDRFTYRGDSLWWFAELYLHKQGVIDRLWRTALGLEALCRDRKLSSLNVFAGDPVLELLGPQVAARLGLRFHLDTSQHPHRRATAESRLALDLRSRFYTWSALASRVRPRPHVRQGGDGGTLAFVHSAFWRKPAASASASADGDEGQEGYIGAVLRALQARTEAQPVRLVGVGPRTNFKARRWWHAIAPGRAGIGEIPVEPIERFASWRALAGSRAIWRERFAFERALFASDAIRAHATILGYDIWPLVADELRGIARLQFPWSARAMDEAAAAMETVRPALVVTYAEAGGWGRALMLEARRRHIPSVGLQHGFIYRHWLNYRHEPDEILPSPGNPADQGFPLPSRTLVYDGFAANHLTDAGHFPASAVAITGSPTLDALVSSVGSIDDAERTRVRAQLDDLARASAPAVLERARTLLAESNSRSPVAQAGAAKPSPAQPSAAKPSAASSAGEEHAGARAGGPRAGAGPRLDLDLGGQPRDGEQSTSGDGACLVVLVTKLSQVRDELPGLLKATSTLDGVRLVIKPHPAETAEPYQDAIDHSAAHCLHFGFRPPNVVVAPPAIDLARLLAVARLLVTVNSTVAIDAIAVGVPALVVGLPNNLSPFVDAGVMAGVSTGAHNVPEDPGPMIDALIHDEAKRAALLERARAFAARQAMRADGRAAARAVDAMIGLL